ncbi:MAG: hypothetical protein ACNI22_03640 [Halarcobacter sp.]
MKKILQLELIEDLLEQKETSSNELDFEKIESELEEIEKLVPQKENEETIEDNSLSTLKDLDFDEDFDNIEEKESNKDIPLEKEIQVDTQGDEMADEFAEFDTLSENDILEALDETNTDIQSNFEIPETPKVTEENQPETSSDSLEVNSNNINDIVNLFSKLLNNKTLEITIKVKD